MSIRDNERPNLNRDDAFMVANTSSWLGVWLDREHWEKVMYPGFVNWLAYRHNATGKLLTPYWAYLLELVYETNRSRDGVCFNGMRDGYEDQYGAIAVLGDCRDVGFSYEAAVRVFEEDLEAKYGDADPEVWSKYWWPHNGEQFILRCLTEYQGEPTPEADWFFHESGWNDLLMDWRYADAEWSSLAFKKFVGEAALAQGRPISTGSINSDTHRVENERLEYDESASIELPAQRVLSAEDNRSERISAKYWQKIYDDFAYAWEDWLTSDYRMYTTWTRDYLNPGKDSKAQNAFAFLMDYGWLEIHDQTQETSVQCGAAVIPWLLMQLNLVDMDMVRDELEDWDTADFAARMLHTVMPLDLDQLVELVNNDWYYAVEVPLRKLGYRPHRDEEEDILRLLGEYIAGVMGNEYVEPDEDEDSDNAD